MTDITASSPALMKHLHPNRIGSNTAKVWICSSDSGPTRSTQKVGPTRTAKIEKPDPKRVYHYAETHDEWLARCRTLANGEPDER